MSRDRISARHYHQCFRWNAIQNGTSQMGSCPSLLPSCFTADPRKKFCASGGPSARGTRNAGSAFCFAPANASTCSGLPAALAANTASPHISRASRGSNPLRSSRPTVASLCLANAPRIHSVPRPVGRDECWMWVARALTRSDEYRQGLPPLCSSRSSRGRSILDAVGMPGKPSAMVELFRQGEGEPILPALP